MPPRLRRLALLLAVGLSACTATAPPTPTPPAAEEAAPPLDLRDLERRVHARVNEVRQHHDRPPLAWSDSLAALARRHSRDMARRGFFDHVNPDGQDATARGARAGITCIIPVDLTSYRKGLGENLLYTYRYDAYRITTEQAPGEPPHAAMTFSWKTRDMLVREIVDGWMQSPPHRHNLLDPLFRTEGLGIVMDDEEKLYVTQNLC